MKVVVLRSESSYKWGSKEQQERLKWGILTVGHTSLKVILSQWAWFSMSTRNFIGSGQNSAHPLLDRDG